jgi:hypothetical protein
MRRMVRGFNRFSQPLVLGPRLHRYRLIPCQRKVHVATIRQEAAMLAEDGVGFDVVQRRKAERLSEGWRHDMTTASGLSQPFSQRRCPSVVSHVGRSFPPLARLPGRRR